MTTNETRLAIDIAKLLEQQFMDPDQIGIIYCTSKLQARLIEGQFTHCASYSDLGDLKEKNEARWKAWKPTRVDEKGDQLPGRWIAATTGLIHGVNPGNVGGVIFIGMPFGLLNFYQGAGRGGRDGRKSWCVLMDATNHHQLAGPHHDDESCVNEANEWTSADECRRLTFTRTFDGKEVACIHLPNCNRCDHCDPNSLLMAEIAKIIVDPIIVHQLVKWPILTTKINSKKYISLIEDINVVVVNQKS
jgi:superfamily II DNA helicase RecQ